MRNTVFVISLAVASCAVAHAADKPVISPAPAWVKPVALPTAPTKGDDAPVRILLSDQQVALEPGRQTVYFETALAIQTPQGLAAGNISVPWRPDTEILTVHKLLIRRGDQVIDVLKSGQTFTVLRREQNLESATLDGVLTANIQPEGLQVGDTLEFAVSVSSSDPTLRGHVEQLAGAWSGLSIGRAHLRIQWPTSLPLRLRQTSDMPALMRTKVGSTSFVELSLDNVEPIVPPSGAPPRYRVARVVEATDFASWADLAALMAPLYEKAAVIPAQGALRTELERIKSLSADPKVRTEAALALVQDRVRYVALAMGAGGYVPADTETTWSRRSGDCKGKTALLLALLHAMGIQAEPVAVSSMFGDGLDARLPMVGLLNHVLVRAVVDGRAYWLDGTRSGDRSLDRLTIPNFGWGLPLQAKDAALVRMLPTPLTTPTQDTSIRIDASAGVSAIAPAKIETVLRGDEAVGANAALANLNGEARDRALKDYWKSQYDFIDVKSTSASFDPKTGEQRLTMEGEAKLDWANEKYQTDGTNVGYRADFSRNQRMDKDAPSATAYPYFNRTRETIVLPKGLGDFKLGAGVEVDQTAGGIEYKRHAAITEGIFTIEKTERSVVPEFPAKDAPAVQAALRMLADRPASVRMPINYRHTKKDLAAVQAEVPTTSAGYVSRAGILISRDMREDALLHYDKAIELDPDNVEALTNRGIARVVANNMAGAKSDFAKAHALSPTFAQDFNARGMHAIADRRIRDAIEFFTRAIAQEPESSFPIGYRAYAYVTIDESDKALADAGAALKLDPAWNGLYLLRANVFLKKGELDRAIAEVQAAIAHDPKLAAAHVAAARVYAAIDRRPDALNEYDQAIALEPRAYIYAEKSGARTPDDKVGRQADIDAAFKLDRKSNEAFAAQAALQQDLGDTTAAIATWSQLIAASPNNPTLLHQRAQVYQRAGDFDRALADTGEALQREPKAIDLYLMRAQMLQNQGKVDEAMREATALVRAAPDNAYNHVVAARMYTAVDRRPEALREYDQATALEPRAYIYAEKSRVRSPDDKVARQADIDAAFKLDPKSNDAFAAQAALYQDSGDTTAAIATWSQLLAGFPNNPNFLTQRAKAYEQSGDLVRALADAGAALQRDPKNVELYLMRATLFRNQGKVEDAAREATAIVTANPDNAYAYVAAANIYNALRKVPEAMKAYDRAIAIKPAAYTYLNRSLRRPKADVAGRQADLDAALQFDPNWGEALAAKASLLADMGKLAEAIATFTRALERSPDQADFLAGRGLVYTRSGDFARGEQDFVEARTKVTDSVTLNRMCWSKATAGIALESALKECNAALARTPGAAGYLDSRGLVLLRLGRLADAISDYDQALSQRPDMPSSLFGRAIAWGRKGAEAKSQIDAAAALKIDPNIGAEFERFGLKLQN